MTFDPRLNVSKSRELLSEGRIDEARAAAYAALDGARIQGNVAMEELATRLLGRIALESGNVHDAITTLSTALALARSIKSRRAEASSLAHLGRAYEKAGRAGDAVRCLEEAVAISRETGPPFEQARRLAALGNAYRASQETDRTTGLQRAIECYEGALRIFTTIGFPVDWAMSQNNLGNAYAELQVGDRRANLTRATECYEAALQTLTEHDFPIDWARTQNNLGNAYASLLTGDRVENLQRGIACYEAALRVWKERDLSAEEARTQFNMGLAFAALPVGDRGLNLQRAIECYEAAMRLYTQHGFREDWARAQYNPAYALADPASAWFDRGMSLGVLGRDQEAVACFEKVLGLFGPSPDVLATMNWVHSLAFSPTGDVLVGGTSGGTVTLWETDTGRQLQGLEGHTDSVTSVAFSYDGVLVVSGSADRTVKLWHSRTGDQLRMFTGHTADVTSVAFSPDGALIASGSRDRTVKLWDARTGPLLRTLESHTDGVESVVFSPDGVVMASGSGDRTVKLWDALAGRLLQTLESHTDRVKSVAFSPDGALVASGSRDRTVKLWDARTGRLVRTFEGHTDGVESVALSPNGAVVASASRDRTVKLWSTAVRQQMHSLKGHADSVMSVAFSPDGTVVASGSADGTVRLWDAKTGHLKGTLAAGKRSDRIIATQHSGNLLANVWPIPYQDEDAYVGSAVFDALIRACFRSGRFIEAFAYSEKSRAGELLLLQATTPGSASASIPPELAAQEQECLQQVRQCLIDAFRENKVVESVELRTRLRQYESLLRRVEEFDRPYADFRRGSPTSFFEVRNWLEIEDREVNLVEYYVTDRETLIFLVTRDADAPVVVSSELGRNDLANLIREWWETMLRGTPQDLRSLSGRLSDLLISPIAEAIKQASVLCIAPYGPLHYLPFQMMKVDEQLLLERYAISVIAGASSMVHLRRLGVAERQSAVVLTDPQTDIPTAQAETEAIKSLFSRTMVLGGPSGNIAASLAALGQADVVHFSGHGDFDREHVLRSSLQLAGNDSLTAEQILSLDMHKSSLVVLSACETGMSEMLPSRQPFGLVQAFLCAGASSVIAPLWGVHGEPAARLTRSFYRHLEEQKLSTADALRAAHLEVGLTSGGEIIPALMTLYGDWK